MFLTFTIEMHASGKNKVYTDIRRGRRFPDSWAAALSGAALESLKRERLVSVSKSATGLTYSSNC